MIHSQGMSWVVGYNRAGKGADLPTAVELPNNPAKSALLTVHTTHAGCRGMA